MAMERNFAGGRDATTAKPHRQALKTPPTDTEEQLTDRLLNAATEVFLEKGFSAATIDEMAIRAKAGKITFYNHFGNKEALFEAIILRINKTIFQGFVSALQADTQG
jgi:AcrR family transcriptional regulator